MVNEGEYTLANGLDYLPLLASHRIETAMEFYYEMFGKGYGTPELIAKLSELVKKNKKSST